jgi:hypothetical protein
VLVVALSLALWPGRASADGPDRVAIPTAEDESIPASPEGPCTFPVLIHVVTNNQYMIVFDDRTITQGRAVLELTNEDTRTSVIRNVSGPGTITDADGILAARGPWFFAFAPGELVDEFGNEPSVLMFINHGTFVLRIGDPERGVPHQIVSQTGVQEDLCATLGASEGSGAEASGCPDGQPSEADASESEVPLEGSPDADPQGIDFGDDRRPSSPGSLLISRERNIESLGESPEIPARITSQTGAQEDLCTTPGASPDGGATEIAATEAAAGDETEIPLGRLA